MQDDKNIWIWFSSCLRASFAVKQRLLLRTGHPRILYEMNETELELLLRKETAIRKPEKLLEAVLKEEDREEAPRIREVLERQKISFISMEDPNYPVERFSAVPDAPFGLYVRGTLPGDEPTAAIVGSRNCSYYGRAEAGKAGRAAAEAGISVVSGLARGIDAAGHEGALSAGGRTYAVLGSGIDVIYPPENKHLYEEIERRGGVISEFPPGMPPLKENFPRRNRIISGLSDQVIVIEAGERSGSLITARLAGEHGREVWALPGRVGDYLSMGTNRLIADGALLLPYAGAFTEFRRSETCACALERKAHRVLPLTEEETKVFELLDSDPRSADLISMLSGLEIVETVRILTELSEKGAAHQIFEGYFVRSEGK